MILYTQNYERQILVNKRPFFKAKWPYSLHIFSLVSLVKKYATCKPIWPFKKAVYSHGSTIHSFFCPIIHFFNNECGKGTIPYYLCLLLSLHFKNYIFNRRLCSMYCSKNTFFAHYACRPIYDFTGITCTTYNFPKDFPLYWSLIMTSSIIPRCKL